MSGWTPAFTIVLCQDCDFTRESHTTGAEDNAAVLAAGRGHARRTGHYVQVERGAVAHYNHPAEPSA